MFQSVLVCNNLLASDVRSIVIEKLIALKNSQIRIVVAFGTPYSLEGEEGVERAWDKQDQAEDDLFPRLRCVTIGHHLVEADVEENGAGDEEDECDQNGLIRHLDFEVVIGWRVPMQPPAVRLHGIP